MLQPKKTKYRKFHKGRVSNLSKRGNNVSFGMYGLQAVSSGRLNSREIEAARLTMVRHLRASKKGYKVWVKVFPDISVSQKPIEVRMGKGKGSPEYWACRTSPGRVIFEVDGVSEDVAREALRKASAKLSIKSRCINSLY